MNVSEVAGARFATWWAEVMTRTAARSVARDRRAEIASDLHEQLSDAASRGRVASASRSVTSRVVRGIPADMAWRLGLELRPGRLGWHLRNPSSAITVMFLVMLPVGWAADSTLPASNRPASWPLLDYRIPLWVATDVIGALLLLFAVASLTTRALGSAGDSAETYRPATRGERARRRATAALGITFAGSAVFRFGIFELIGGVCWFSFAGCLLVYAAILLASALHMVLTLGRYLPKVGGWHLP
jgi:hypothetical protein